MSLYKIRVDACRDAKARGIATITGFCLVHPTAPIDTETGHCTECIIARGHMGDRLKYLSSGGFNYRKLCETHGPDSLHYGETDKCISCFTTRGTPRTGMRTANPDRAAARRAGASAYIGQCEIHGTTAHNVVHGKCLTCFTTAGTPRAGTNIKAFAAMLASSAQDEESRVLALRHLQLALQMAGIDGIVSII